MKALASFFHYMKKKWEKFTPIKYCEVYIEKSIPYQKRDLNLKDNNKILRWKPKYLNVVFYFIVDSIMESRNLNWILLFKYWNKSCPAFFFFVDDHAIALVEMINSLTQTHDISYSFVTWMCLCVWNRSTDRSFRKCAKEKYLKKYI